MNYVRSFLSLLRETLNQWWDREPFNNSIIIAFYTIFSLPGLLVIMVNVTSYFYDKKEVTNKLAGQIQNVVGGETAKDIESIIAKASESRETVMSSMIGIVILLFGATGVFYELQQMLNKIWNVKRVSKTKNKIMAFLNDRLLSFGIILAVGFLLLASLMLSTALGAVSDWVSSHWSASWNTVFRIFDVVLSLSVITFLFASIFKFLPDVKIRWKDVWGGAFLTAFLFVWAKFALGLYFGQSNPGSIYGAAGSIVLIMLWVSYAGLILLFGAEFTQVYTTQKAKPTSIAAS